jgi:DNA-binding winged helix-turn-helix (wHTH) protein
MPYVSPICFPPFRLDPEDARLWHEARPLPLRPKAFAVLHYLLQHPGQLVTKEQLAKAVWSSTVVSETVLRVCLREIRRVLDDRATEPRFVETVPRRGYRFIGTIRTEDQAKPREHWPGAATLVGRAEELTRLHHLLEQARAGTRTKGTLSV